MAEPATSTATNSTVATTSNGLPTEASQVSLYPTVEQTEEALLEEPELPEVAMARSSIQSNQRNRTSTVTAIRPTNRARQRNNQRTAAANGQQNGAAATSGPTVATPIDSSTGTGTAQLPQNQPDVQPSLQASLVPHVVDATDVAVVMSEQEEKQVLKRRRKRVLLAGGSVCVVIAIVIIIPLLLLAGHGTPTVVLSTSSPTALPSAAPSVMPSGAPTTETFDKLLTFLQDYTSFLSDEQWWNDPSSAPYKAALWLSSNGSWEDYDPARTLQRFALATFYYATGGKTHWQECAASLQVCDAGKYWLSNDNECNWQWITCQNNNNKNDGSGVVSSLNFPAANNGNNLHGTLPPQFSLLSQLQVVALANNRYLSGDIDSAFQGITTLRTININGNQFGGKLPTDIFQHNRDLTDIYFGANAFTGSIPVELLRLPKLTQLHLYRNHISGPLPTAIGLLSPSLTQLYLHENELTGSLPAQFYALTDLTDVNLSNNTLTGSLDNVLFPQLRNLRYFSARYIDMMGTLPEGMFITMPYMTVWKTDHAQFQGTLSGRIAHWNQTLSQLWLQNNQFTGELPTALDELTSLSQLKLENNHFHGTISAALCDQRGNQYQELAVLTVDCQLVNCSCCDSYDC